MMPHVVATAVEYNLPAVWVLHNNYAIGTIRDLQRAYHDGRELGTSFVNERTGKLWNPDFAKMAEAHGRTRHSHRTSRSVRRRLRARRSAPIEPTVIEVVINRDTGIPITGTWQMPPIPEVQPTFGRRKVR